MKPLINVKSKWYFALLNTAVNDWIAKIPRKNINIERLTLLATGQ